MVALVPLAILSLLSMWSLCSIWRNPKEVEAPDAAYRIFCFGAGIRRGIIRAQVAICGILWSILIGFGASLSGGDELSNVLAVITVMGIGGGAFVFAVIGVLIVVINRPRCLVPPHMRQDSGLLKKRPHA
ncbi:hypothetical protein [Embleya sp. NPDC001921]